MTSYAVSPQAVFTCAPCSVRSRPQGLEPARRFTYYSVTDSEPKLHCFKESCDVGFAKGREFHGFTLNIKDTASPVIHLDTLAVDSKEALQSSVKLLAVHKDGEIRCLSQDLQMEEWKTRVIDTSSSYVEHASVMSLEQASQSLLRNREDILAMLGHDADTSVTRLLFLLTRASSVPANSGGNQLYLRIFHIRISERARQPLQDLTSLTLPEPQYSKSEKCNYSWHGSSGTLLQNTASDLAVYDVAGLLPRLAHHIPLGNTKITSCLRLSASLIALNTSEAITIIDLQYSSLQAEQTLEQWSKNQSQTANFKHTSKEESGTRILSYFAPLDLVVVLQGRKLLALQLSTVSEQASNSRKRKRTGLLINSIGRGMPSCTAKVPTCGFLPGIAPLGTRLPNSRSQDGWNTTRDRLESLFQSKDVEQFESIMLSELGPVDEKEGNNLTPVELNRSVEPRPRNLPDYRKVHYLLNKIFVLEQSQQPTEQSAIEQKLKVSWFSDILCRHLIRQGLFSIDHIEAAMKHSHSFPTTEHIKVGAYTQALVEWDKSLKTLQLILRSPVPLDAKEIAHAMRYLMHFVNQSEAAVPMKQLTDGDQREDEGFDQRMQYEDDNVSIDSISPSSKVKLKISHDLLDSILTRLNFFSVSKLTQALKTELSPQELRSLVDLLRIELARGQWLSAYGDHPGDGHSDNGQICIIAKLLNSVIDSIGTGGWILGASLTDDLTETEDTIAYMKAEISAALEGIEEATYLKGLLGQILLYGKANTLSQGKPRNPPGANQQPLQIRPVPVSSAGTESSALPLGLKAAQGITRKKVGAGGELIERSRRDIGRLKNRMVGIYSFDRILI